jgi:hypothetical protein
MPAYNANQSITHLWVEVRVGAEHQLAGGAQLEEGGEGSAHPRDGQQRDGQPVVQVNVFVDAREIPSLALVRVRRVQQDNGRPCDGLGNWHGNKSCFVHH